MIISSKLTKVKNEYKLAWQAISPEIRNKIKYQHENITTFKSKHRETCNDRKVGPNK